MNTKYGIDAPYVVRNLFLFGFIALALSWPVFWIESPVWFWIAFSYAATTALTLLAFGVWMVYSAWVVKPKVLSRLLDKFALKEDEILLDLGCGRGLLMIEAAKRLTQGKAFGVDLWIGKDQSGNRMEAAWDNAQEEGVGDRIEIHTADIRSLPFPDASFDAVVSSLVIHNICQKREREKALSEMLRVLKPGGRFFLLDLHYGKEYAAFLNQTKQAEAACSLSGYYYCLPVRVVQGKKLDIETA